VSTLSLACYCFVEYVLFRSSVFLFVFCFVRLFSSVVVVRGGGTFLERSKAPRVVVIC
jgi:hypothetical protein